MIVSKGEGKRKKMTRWPFSESKRTNRERTTSKGRVVVVKDWRERLETKCGSSFEVVSRSIEEVAVPY